MLIPRFSLRGMLGVLTACSAFFLILSLALQGQAWAIAVSLVVASLLLVLAIHALLFSLAWGIAMLVRAGKRQPVVGTPFATSAPPPQLIRPEDPQ